MAREILALAVVLLALLPAAARAGDASVRFKDGLVSATFDATPVAEALDAIRHATGVEVVLPLPARAQTLTLGVEQAPFERFLHRVLDALDLGGFALVYASSGGAERLIVVEKGRGGEAPAAGRAKNPNRSAPEARASSRPARVSVPFLMRRAEAESMRLGTPGQVMVVQSPPAAKTTTSQCDGTAAAYPVQTVLVTDAANTYISAVVVCARAGLQPGETLTLTPADPDISPEPDATHSRFSATAR